ncbi:MAG: hypothetical protein FWC92_10585 [Defluviitaleaceae bacterium]|nr:hypothetical protein [Defluviitaleaceae bacterium]
MKKRLCAILFAVTMVLSMSVTAFGDPFGQPPPPIPPGPLSICISGFGDIVIPK